MAFIITAFDHPDALERRLQVRQVHIDYIDTLKNEGKVYFGVALVENDRMIGSSIITSYTTKQEVDEYLENEPYVQNKVWDKIEVQSCLIGPSFIK